MDKIFYLSKSTNGAPVYSTDTFFINTITNLKEYRKLIRYTGGARQFLEEYMKVYYQVPGKFQKG